ncbi:MAG: hypothetical protein PHN57_02955 [Candidatus Omnitrophica bacterium]|nr:hypothetical protein [Candidatus Omnitrophota bacterium]
MRRILPVILAVILGLPLVSSFAQQKKDSLILLVSEQNIAGPQHAWWASEIDLSVTEAGIARKLMEAGLEVIEPQAVRDIIKKEPAFKVVGISEGESIKLAGQSKADFIVLGKAVASAGGNVPQSNMISCFANITAKLIRVKDGKILAYLDASGNSAHLDTVTGGKEALTKASDELAKEILEALKKEGVK